MPRINLLATTKNAILGDNVSGYVNWAIDDKGQRKSTVINELKKRYPNASSQTIQAVYGHVIDTRSSGRAATRLDPNGKLPAGAMPSNPNLPQSYHYRVVITLPNGPNGEKRAFTSLVDSGTNLTRSEIEDRAWDKFINTIRINVGRRSRSDPPEVSERQQTTMHIQYVEKRAR